MKQRVEALALQLGQVALRPGRRRGRRRPCERSASSTPLPDISDTSRSADAAAHQHGDLAERWRRSRRRHAHARRSRGSSSSTCAGTSPIEPAPIAITTSPSRACSTIASGSRVDVVDEHRVDLAGHAQRARQRAAVGARRSAPRRRHRPRRAAPRRPCAMHLDEILEAVARARVAVRLEGQHQAPPREGAARRGEHRRHLDRVVAVVVDQREAAAACAAAPAARRSAGSAGRRRGTSASALHHRLHRAAPARRPPRSRPARSARCARPAGSASTCRSGMRTPLRRCTVKRICPPSAATSTARIMASSVRGRR